MTCTAFFQQKGVLFRIEDIIKVENVAKGYAKHQVLQNLDLNIKKGERFTLLGPSGCGKTVLIRLIAGHEVPDAGKISIDNTIVADSSSGESWYRVPGLRSMAAHDGLRKYCLSAENGKTP